MLNDIVFFRKEYKKQKKLEEIVRARELKRPKIKKWQVATAFVILPFLLFITIFFCLKINKSLTIRLLITGYAIIFIIEIYLRFCFILTIKCYQHYAKEETRRRCKCIPSCSEYSIMSLKIIFPLIFAIKKIKKRLYHTCDGEDYKIDFPTKKRSKKFESLL